MSDALARNAVADASMRIRCHCLAHGRRKCSDLEAVFPHACQVVLDVMRQVFDHDEQARTEQLSPAARLAYHPAHRQPLLDGRTRWRATQIDAPLVEPNSARGTAIVSMQNHWETLTRFFSVAGAPLDNTLAERTVQRCIRQRKNSLFYKSMHGAYIASVLTSVIAPCVYAGVNAGESLVALPEHRGEGFADPAAWLPWASASSRASPEARRRPSWAICARSGWPCHNKRRSARAERDTRASVPVGHQAKRPCERRFISNQEPWPS
jgi:hypothetical protein